MKTASGQLTATLYGQNIHRVADCYTFYLGGGAERYTSADTDIVSGALTWSCAGPGIEHGDIETSTGLEVATLDLTLASGTLGNVPTAEAALAGDLDGVRVTLDRAFFSGSTLAGMVNLFDGPIIEVKPGSTEVQLTAKSEVALLNEPWPRRSFQAQCPYQVYGVGCGLSTGSFNHTRTVASGTTERLIKLSATSSFAVVGSWVEVLDGDQAGQRRTVVSTGSDSSELNLLSALSPALEPGVSVRVLRGCDKTRPTCRDVFGNLVRFGGFPDTPHPEATIDSQFDYWTPPPRDPGIRRDRLDPIPVPKVSYLGPPVPVVYGTARCGGTTVYARSVVSGTFLEQLPFGLGFAYVDGEMTNVVIGICEAPITGSDFLWNEQYRESWDALYTRWNATPPAIPVGELTGPWPGYEDGGPASGTQHSGTIVFANEHYHLKDGQIEELQFQIRGRCSVSSAYAAGDFRDAANPADVIVDMLTEPRTGAGLASDQIQVDVGQDGTAASGYRRYCEQMGFYVSRAVTDRSDAATLVKELCEATNAIAFWSEGKLKVVPLDDETVGTFVPVTSSIPIGEDELLHDGDDPVTVERTPESEVFNTFPITIRNRLADYNLGTYEWTEPSHASLYGVRKSNETTMAWVTDPQHAMDLSTILANRSINQRNRFTFRLGPRWALLEPGDLVSLSDSVMGLSGSLVRVMRVSEDTDGALELEALEWPLGSAKPMDIAFQTHDGYDYSGSYIFSPRAEMTYTTSSVAYQTASMAYVTASAAYATASSATDLANAAMMSASAALATGTEAFVNANAAYGLADDAFQDAQDALDGLVDKADTDLGNIPAGTVTGIHVASGTLSGTHIAALTISGTHIAGQTISGTHIAGSTISGTHIAAGTIQGSHISGTTLSSIFADIGIVTAGVVQNASGTAQFDLNNSRITFDNGTVVKITGLGFGSGSDLIEWVGLRTGIVSGSGIDIGLCSTSNSIQHITTTGDAYFGGTLSAGVLKNAATSTLTTTGLVLTVGPFSTNGGSRSVVLSYTCSQRGEKAGDQSATSGTITATVVLKRSVNGGAASTIATLNVSANWTPIYDGETDTSFWVRTMNGSTTTSDSTGSSGDDITYTAEITSRSGTNLTGWTVATNSQSTSIVSTE